MKRVLLGIFLVLVTYSVMASHIVGGSITYTCTNSSTNQYLITMVLYRDCNGSASLPNPATVRYYPGNTGAGITFSMSQISFTTMTLTTDPCINPPSGLCYQKGVYQATLTLPPQTNGYTIAWSDCCRNNSISNILAPGSVSAIYSAKIPNPGLYPCNSSPAWNSDPPALFCINHPINYSYSATDPNSDSLAYRFAPSNGVTGGNTNPGTPPFPVVPYSGSYNGFNPLPANPALSINPVTGFLTGTPNTAGQYVVTICVDEFRNGVKIGEYCREYQFNIVSCTNSISASAPGSSIFPGGGTPFMACNSLTVTFPNTSTGTTSFIWDFGVTGTNADTSNLQYPTYTYADTGTYIVRLIAGPGQVCADTAYLTVKVYPGITANYTHAGSYCSGNPVNFTNTSTTVYGSISGSSWIFTGPGVTNTTQTNPTITFPFAYPYNVKLVVTNSFGCKDSTIQTIQINASPTMNIPVDTINICVGGSAVINATSNGSVTWSPATGLSCTNCLSPTANPTTTTTYIATATAANNCTFKDTVVVKVHPTPVVNAGPDIILCNSNSQQINGSVSNISGNYTVTWSPVTGLTNATTLTPTANPTSTTQYILTVTNAANCSAKDTVMVYRNILSVNAGSPVNICVNDSTQLSATSSNAGTYSWSPTIGLSNPNIPNPYAKPLATATYTVTLTDTAGCTATSSVTVNVISNNSVDAGPNTSICLGSNTTLTPSGGANYVWDAHPSLSCTNCTSPVATPTVTTIYYVTASAAGCSGRDSVIITVNPKPSFTASSANQIICIGNNTTLSASGTGLSYSWTPAASLSCTSCASPVATPTSTTTYTVTATDNNGCSDTRTVTVSVNPKPVIDAGPDSTGLCIGKSKQLTATGGVSYVWSPATALSCTNCPNPSASPLSTITYTVTGTDANGCTNKDSIKVVVQPFLPITVTPNSDLCIGSTLQLNATGGTQYQWTPTTGLSNPNIPNPVASPVTTTTYSVVVTDANGCSNSGSVTVTVNPLPTVTVSPAATICAGSSTNLSASGGVSYAWLPSAGLSNANIPNPVASPVTTITYTVTVTDNKGCKNTGTVLITVNPKPNISAGADKVICIGDSTQLNVTGGVSYVWTPATGLSCTNCANPKASPSSTTTYTITGTGANGCINYDTIMVTVNLPPVISFLPLQPEICYGDSIKVTASGANSYTWSPATGLSCTNCPDPFIKATTTTTYTVIGNNGCTSTASIQVKVNPLPIPVVSTAQTICEGSQVQINASGGSSYSWTPTSSLSCTTCPNPIASPNNTTIYTVVVTDFNGCKASANVTVNVNSKPPVNAGLDKTICINDSVQLNVTGAINYAWAPATGLSCANCPDPFAKPTTTTTYIVLGTDASGCTNKDTIKVTVNSLPVLTFNPAAPEICEGSNIKLGVSGANSYTWAGGTGLSCTTCPDPVASPNATTTYTVTGNDGCISTSTITVVVNPNPVVTAIGDTTICIGKEANLSAGGANTYSWSPPAGLSCTNCVAPKASPTATTTYIVTGTDSKGCQNSASVKVDINLPADPSAGNDSRICIGDSIQLSASNGVSYFWEPNSYIDDNYAQYPVVNPTFSTSYIVTILDINGCENKDTVRITVNNLPNISAGLDQYIYEGERAILIATGGVSYIWEPADLLNNPFVASPLAIPVDTTTFYVKGTDINGCTNDDSMTVFVLGIPEVLLPTGFSPNSDGQNDEFKIGYYDNFNLTSLRVYNRWGQIVFETQDINKGWNGDYLGTPQPVGTYVFVVEGVDEIGKFIKRFGNVTLLR